MLDAQNEAGEIVALVAGEAGRGLVEQQQRRLQRQRAGEADDLLDAERQRAGMGMAHALQLHELDDALHGLAVQHLLAPHRRQEQHRCSGLVGKRAWRPVMMLSSTLMCGNSSTCWKVRAMPSLATARGDRPEMSCPRKRMRRRRDRCG